MSIKGGGVRRLMIKSILEFPLWLFDYLPKRKRGRHNQSTTFLSRGAWLSPSNKTYSNTENKQNHTWKRTRSLLACLGLYVSHLMSASCVLWHQPWANMQICSLFSNWVKHQQIKIPSWSYWSLSLFHHPVCWPAKDSRQHCFPNEIIWPATESAQYCINKALNSSSSPSLSNHFKAAAPK